MFRQRGRIRTLLTDLTDADLERPAFSHFFGIGFGTVGAALAGTRLHSFSEGWELAQRLKRPDIRFPERLVRNRVRRYVNLVRHAEPRRCRESRTLHRGHGRAGLRWWHVDHSCHRRSWAVTEDRAASADLVMRLSADTYMTMFKKLRNPMLRMLTGKIRVKGFSKMETFGKLFSEPELDTPMRITPSTSAAIGGVA
jgi:hypothetical protein